MLSSLDSSLPILSVIIRVLGFLSALHAVARSRTPQGAIAWGISLVSFPHLALLAYWVFGRDRFHGYVRALRAGHLREQHGQHVKNFLDNMKKFQCQAEPSRQQDLKTMERLAGMPFTDCNKVKLLADVEDAFSEMFRAIDAAEDYILVYFYIVKNDKIGKKLKERLAERCQAGIPVYFLYDEFGSFTLSWAYLRELRKAGVVVRPFVSTPGRWSRWQINFRNHRKALVVDGKVGFVGGCNVSDENLGWDPRIGPWRDTHLRIEGPAVQGIQLVYAEDFYWATGSIPQDLCWDTKPATEGKQKALYIPSGPNDALDEGVLLFLQSIQSARHRLWIASPYFIPDPSVLEALKLAALRGVDIRIILPEHTGVLVCHLAAYSYLPEIRGTGIRLYRYMAGEAHQKVCLIDDDIAWVGSSNMDNRSMRLNFEGNVAVMDREFASEVEEMLLEDLKRSELWDFSEYDHRTWAFQAAVQLSRLFAPIL